MSSTEPLRPPIERERRPTSDISPGVGRADLFDTGLAKLWRGYAFRSVLRHWRRAAATFLLLFGAASFFALSSAKAFLVTTDLTAKADIVSAVANPGRSQALSGAKPILNAEALITADDNLKKILAQTHLLERYKQNDSKLAKLRSKIPVIGGGSGGVATEEDVLRLLRGAVAVDADQQKDSVTIKVTWNEPFQARDIAKAAQTNFLEDRRRAEVQPREEALKLVEKALERASVNVESLRAQLGIPADSRDPLPESSPLKDALQQKAVLSQRRLDAQLELEAADKGFQYSYSEVRPPEVPLAPVKGNLKTVVLGFILASGAAMAVSVAADARKGAIIEPWQVARKLNLRVLAELPRP